MILARPIEFAANLSFPISSGFSAVASSALATDVIESERSRSVIASGSLLVGIGRARPVSRADVYHLDWLIIEVREQLTTSQRGNRHG